MTEPDAAATRPWLVLLPDESRPRVLAAVASTLVVWSTLWPTRPEVTVRFDLEPDRQGTALRWTLLTSGELPDAGALGHLRFRMNLVVNRDLRLSYGQ